MNETDWRFVHDSADTARWSPGLRDIFEYRDLGIRDATGGDYVAHVLRRNGRDVVDAVQDWHVHECSFQLVYVLEGWSRFEYEGVGVRTLTKGDCVLQTPSLRHRELACSDDYAVLEIVAPADFATRLVPPPDQPAPSAPR